MYHRVASCRKAGSRLFCVADGSQQQQRRQRPSARGGSGEGPASGGDPLRERIYLEGAGSSFGGLSPEPLPVTHSAAFLQRSRGVWQEVRTRANASQPPPLSLSRRLSVSRTHTLLTLFFSTGFVPSPHFSHFFALSCPGRSRRRRPRTAAGKRAAAAGASGAREADSSCS